MCCYKIGRFCEYRTIQEYLRGYDGADAQSRIEALSNIDVEDDGSDEPDEAELECKKLDVHAFKLIRF